MTTDQREAIGILIIAGWPTERIKGVLGVSLADVDRVRSRGITGRPAQIDSRLISALLTAGYTTGEVADMLDLDAKVVSVTVSSNKRYDRKSTATKRMSGRPGERTMKIVKRLMDGDSVKDISHEEQVSNQLVYRIKATATKAGLLK